MYTLQGPSQPRGSTKAVGRTAAQAPSLAANSARHEKIGSPGASSPPTSHSLPSHTRRPPPLTLAAALPKSRTRAAKQKRARSAQHCAQPGPPKTPRRLCATLPAVRHTPTTASRLAPLPANHLHRCDPRLPSSKASLKPAARWPPARRCASPSAPPPPRPPQTPWPPAEPPPLGTAPAPAAQTAPPPAAAAAAAGRPPAPPPPQTPTWGRLTPRLPARAADAGAPPRRTPWGLGPAPMRRGKHHGVRHPQRRRTRGGRQCFLRWLGARRARRAALPPASPAAGPRWTAPGGTATWGPARGEGRDTGREEARPWGVIDLSWQRRRYQSQGGLPHAGGGVAREHCCHTAPSPLPHFVLHPVLPRPAPHPGGADAKHVAAVDEPGQQARRASQHGARAAAEAQLQARQVDEGLKAGRRGARHCWRARKSCPLRQGRPWCLHQRAATVTR